MIDAVLIAPGAPWLVPGLAPATLAAQHTLADAVRRAVATELTPGTPLAVLAAASPAAASRWAAVLPGGPGEPAVSSGWGRPAPGDTVLPGPWALARALLGDRPAAAGLLGDDGTAVTAALQDWQRTDRCALLVLADGAHSHGEHAPGAPDERAPAVDDALHGALLAGPAAEEPDLTALDDDGGHPDPLGATLPRVLRALRPVLAGQQFTARSLLPDPGWTAPYGVGHHLVAWHRR